MPTAEPHDPSKTLAGVSKLELTIELRPSDVVRSHFRALIELSLVRLWIGGVVLICGAWLLVFLGFIGVADRDGGEAERLLVASTGLLLALLVTGMVARRVGREAHQHFATMKESERRGTYVLDDGGFSWSLGKSPGSRSWEDVRRADESRNYVFLHERRGVTHALPKRDMDPEHESRLRRVLSEALRERAFL